MFFSLKPVLDMQTEFVKYFWNKARFIVKKTPYTPYFVTLLRVATRVVSSRLWRWNLGRTGIGERREFNG